MTDPPIRQQVMKYLAEQFPGATLADHQFGADRLLAIFTAHAAAVRVEAVAGERREAFTRAAGLLQTEAAFQERQAAEHEFQRDARRFAIQRLRLCERVLRDQAAGSVPVATPAGHVHGFALSGRCVCGAVATPEDDGDDEPLTHEEVVACLADARGEPDWVAPVATPTEPEPYRACAGCDGPDLCKFCGYQAATPTELLSDELLDRWAAAVTLPGEYAAQLVDEVRRLRAAMASPVPAEQPPTCAHRQLCSYPNCRHVDSRVWPAAEQPEER